MTGKAINPRRIFTTILFILLSTPFIGCSRESRLPPEDEQAYHTRDLLIPDQDYKISDVRNRLMESEPVYFIEPGKELPPERYEEYLHDSGSVVQEGLLNKVEREIEELLFEE